MNDMTKDEYFRLAMRAKLYRKKAWIVSAFAVTKDSPSLQMVNYPYKLIRTVSGIAYFDPDTNEVSKDIVGSKPNEPLLKFLSPFKTDATVTPNAYTPVDTTYGNVLVNLICLVESFGRKIPFISGDFKVRKVENLVASRLVDNPKEISSNPSDKTPNEFLLTAVANPTTHDSTNDPIYVYEYIRFTDSLTFINGLAQLCAWSSTEKNTTPAPGIEKKKAELIAKYGDDLRDPSKLAAFEDELKKFDAEYLKGDPSFGKFMSGKNFNTARKRMFGAVGNELEFTSDGTVNPLLNSLEQGWEFENSKYTTMMNGIRYGSYSRGADTVLGGVSMKFLLRALDVIRIDQGDCGSPRGMKRTFDKSNYTQLVGRTAKTSNGWKKIEDLAEAATFIGKEVEVRSFMYCQQTPSTHYCSTCAGDRYGKALPGAPAIGVTEISGIVLYAFMKKLHSSTIVVETMTLEEGWM